MAIPIVLLYFTRRRRDIPFRHLFWLFGAFIILCGATHFMDFYTFYSPVYRLSGLVKLLTAIASWGTVLALIPTTPKALAMRSPDELEAEIALRTNELLRTNDELTAKHAQNADLNEKLRRAMAETHHRVKNNLQVVSALVDLQVLNDSEAVPKSELRRIAQHIRSLAMIHEMLTRQARREDEVEFVSARETIQNIVPILREVVDGRRIEARADDFQISVKHGTAIAVLVNELVSNAVKHGSGDIAVELTRKDGETPDDPSRISARLAVCDHGPGFPRDFDPLVSANTGLDLVENLVRWDLGGEPTYLNRPEGGACVQIDFHVDMREGLVRA